MSPKPETLVVESLVDAPLEMVWDRTQNPKNHIRWDIRFTDIQYLERKDKKGFNLLQYKTRIGFGFSITGNGRYLQTVIHEKSAFEFWSDDIISLIAKGKGIWLYQPLGGKTYFKTVFDYNTRFGLLGKFVDSYIFRPMFCLATEWGFESLRLWCEGEADRLKKRKSWLQFTSFLLGRAWRGGNSNAMTYSWLGGGNPKHSRLLNPDPSNHILLFDGVCNLCNGLVQFVIGRDPESKFSFASLQSETGSKLLHKYGLPTDDMDTFVYIRNGIAYKKSTAGLFTLKDLGGVWSIAFMLVFIPTLIRDFFYDLLATHRHGIFGKKNTCMIPSSETKDRFLD